MSRTQSDTPSDATKGRAQTKPSPSIAVAWGHPNSAKVCQAPMSSDSTEPRSFDVGKNPPGELANWRGDPEPVARGTLYRHPGRPAINVARARRSSSRAQRPIPFNPRETT